MNTPQINDGGPAFSSWPYKPWKHEPSINEMNYYSGMTLRDWFAGQALSGLLACPKTSGTYDGFVTDAYKYADSMISQRNKV